MEDTTYTWKKFTPIAVSCLLGPLGLWLFGRIDSQNTPNGGYKPPLAVHPPPLSPTAHPLICATHDITVVVKKVAQNPAVLAS